ncbi:cytochrome P450 4C1-like [Cydia splendana]|uniref:cytochrome P450 4C1-like n=1 Tax=Cydia splendana TaxID=1100963 RepID=UPI0021403CEC
MFWQLLAIAAVFWTVYLRWQRRRIRKVNEEISSGALQELPVIGHAHLLGGNHEDVMQLFQKVGRIATAQGGLSTFWLVHKLYLVVTDPLSAEVIMKSCVEKDNFTMKFIRTVVGNGSIFAPVSIWRPRRKILAPTFSMKNLNQFVEVFDKQSHIMAKQLKETAYENVSVWKYITTYTFDSICETVMGVQLGSQFDTDQPFLKSFEKVADMVSKRIATPWLHPDLIYKSIPSYKEFVKHRKVLYDFINDLIQRKRNDLALHGEDANDKRSFLQMLIMESGGEKGYTDLELCEETMVLIMAGTDTSAVGTAFTTVLMSRFQDIQAKVYEELQEVFGDSDRPLTVQDLPSLKYLEAVVKESLRMYPPVPVIVREVNNDVVLPNGTTLVEGVSVFLNIWGIHRNNHYWGDDVDVFRPERFLEGPLKHPVQFTPFSHAPRNCLGYNYAMMSMKTAVANLLRKYKVLPFKGLDQSEYDTPLRVKFDIMMKPVEDYVVRLEPRECSL